jgi:hypothetical protein
VAVEIQFQPRRGLDGLLLIKSDGQPDVTINDEIWHQLSHLLRALAEVHTGESPYAAIPYFSQPGAYEITPEGEHLVLSGDYVPTARYARDALSRAVVTVATRWLAHASTADADHRSVAPDVAAALDAARAVLTE